ncbi:MAG: GNAT family N-acetyltransferase [Lachnospiraceae bacterium]|nr:GNAT family N-acetyltransferase [Lachnospiraceae bacterium]
MVKVKKLCRLNGRQREEIRELEAQCKEKDRTKKSVYLSADQNARKNVKCFYLHYDEEQLDGFLCADITDEETAELYAFVHPEKRHRGIFSRLLNLAIDELEKAGIEYFYGLYEPTPYVTNKALLGVDAEYSYSEYMMCYQYPLTDDDRDSIKGLKGRESFIEERKAKEIGAKESTDTQSDPEKTGILRLAEAEDAAFCTDFLEAVFQFEKEEAKERFENFQSASDSRSYVFLRNGEKIGFCSIYSSKNTNTIFDLGILPAYQGNGNGTLLLSLLLECLQQDTAEDGTPKEILLQTGSYNEPAVALYKSSGFLIKDQIDYYMF